MATVRAKLTARFFVFLPNVLYALSLVWILLYPAVNVTTGEVKPRGLYVDEHALLVQSQLFRGPALAKRQKHGICLICDHYRNSATACRNVFAGEKDNNQLTEIILAPPKSKLLYESTVVVLRYVSNDTCSLRSVTDIVDSLALYLERVQWMAKNVVILLQGSDPTSRSDSKQIDDWLAMNHRPSHEHLQHVAKDRLAGQLTYEFGTIREAYVLDMTTSELCTGSETQFNALTLQHTGTNGLLPNMDMIAYPLSIHADILQTESANCAAQLASTVTNNLYALTTRNNTSSLVGEASSFLWNSWSEIESSKAARGYRDRLLGLVCSMCAHIVGGDRGFHASFLEYNIDSITVKLETTRNSSGSDGVNGGASASTGKSKRDKKASRGNRPPAVYGLEKLVEVALSFIYISNNLHGTYGVQQQ
jgi:hypothetical protein